MGAELMHGGGETNRHDDVRSPSLYTNALDKHLAYNLHTMHKLHFILRWASTIASLFAVYTPGGVLFLILLRYTVNGTSTPISWCLAVLNNSPISWPAIFVRSNAARYMRVTNWSFVVYKWTLRGAGRTVNEFSYIGKPVSLRLLFGLIVYICVIFGSLTATVRMPVFLSSAGETTNDNCVYVNA